MNKQQIITLIESNKLHVLKFEDFAGNKLAEIQAKDFGHAISELEELLPNFAAYKKIVIYAKKGTEDVPWSKGCKWQFEFEGVAPDAKINGMIQPSTGIGAQEHISTVIGMMKENNELTKELMKQKLQADNTDPTKWLPVIKAAAEILGPVFGLEKRGTAIAGTDTKELHFGDVEKLTDEQILDKMNEQLTSLSKKMKGSDFLKILIALNENPEVGNQAKDIAIILKALINKPHLLETALKFI